MERKYTHVIHPFEPVYDDKSKILILGTLPSVKSREQQFYYGHKQNRFWKVLETIYGEIIPDSIEGKKAFLLGRGIAVWDVIYSCDIIGSSDSSIKNVTPTKIFELIQNSEITKIYANGKKAEALYNKYQREMTRIEIIPLPSTSPANAAWNIERLAREWEMIKDESEINEITMVVET